MAVAARMSRLGMVARLGQPVPAVAAVPMNSPATAVEVIGAPSVSRGRRRRRGSTSSGSSRHDGAGWSRRGWRRSRMAMVRRPPAVRRAGTSAGRAARPRATSATAAPARPAAPRGGEGVPSMAVRSTSAGRHPEDLHDGHVTQPLDNGSTRTEQGAGRRLYVGLSDSLGFHGDVVPGLEGRRRSTVGSRSCRVVAQFMGTDAATSLPGCGRPGHMVRVLGDQARAVDHAGDDVLVGSTSSTSLPSRYIDQVPRCHSPRTGAKAAVPRPTTDPLRPRPFQSSRARSLHHQRVDHVNILAVGGRLEHHSVGPAGERRRASAPGRSRSRRPGRPDHDQVPEDEHHLVGDGEAVDAHVLRRPRRSRRSLDGTVAVDRRHVRPCRRSPPMVHSPASHAVTSGSLASTMSVTGTSVSPAPDHSFRRSWRCRCRRRGRWHRRSP